MYDIESVASVASSGHHFAWSKRAQQPFAAVADIVAISGAVLQVLKERFELVALQ